MCCRTRLIETRRSNPTAAQGTASIIGNLLRTEGILGLYRGLVPTMMKQCANSAVRFSSYQGLKDLVLSQRATNELDSLSIMAIGSCAGMITVCKSGRRLKVCAIF